ncbi:glycosyltransferase family A protein [Maribacter litopenaei]
MKLKEYPSSIYHTLKLLTKSTRKMKDSKKEQIPVIVSFTSIPSRVRILHIVVRSILNQSVLPEKVILWLHEDLKDELPKKLTVLKDDLFSIHYTNQKSSHRKLVLALEKLPNKTIVTCDDDVIYHPKWLELLYKDHQRYPDCISANQVRYIKYDINGNLLPYKQWDLKKNEPSNSKAILPIGVGGVLYPAESLSKEVSNKDLYLKITPRADDLWFKAMSLLKGTKSKLSDFNPKKPIPIINSQKESLKRENVDEDKNRTQWLAVTEYFKIGINEDGQL